MPFARLFGSAFVGKDEFAQWARECAGVQAVQHYHALRAAWPFLAFSSQKVLDIGADSGPWMHTLQHFCGHRHDLWAFQQGAASDPKPIPAGVKPLPAELDVWSPLRNREAPNALAEKGFTLVTALDVIDRMYHPELLLKVIGNAMAPRGVLIISASNVARFGNVFRLLRGGGLAGDLDALIGRDGLDRPRPRVREYCWQELTAAALQAGLAPVSHHFYNDPAEAPGQSELDEPARRAIAPFLREREQLQSEMILIFRKAGAMSVGLHRARRGVYPLLREAHAKFNVVRQRLRYGKM